MKRTIIGASLGLGILSLALPLLLSGCGSVNGEASTSSPVMLHVLFEDVTWCPTTEVGLFGYTHEVRTLKAQARAVSPNIDGTSYLMDVVIDEVTISYTRTDTGADVPAPFTTAINYSVPLDTEVEMDIITLRGDQKLQVPLLYLNEYESYGYEPGTGLTEIACTMHLHFVAHTLAGEPLTADTVMPQIFGWGAYYFCSDDNE